MLERPFTRYMMRFDDVRVGDGARSTFRHRSYLARVRSAYKQMLKLQLAEFC